MAKKSQRPSKKKNTSALLTIKELSNNVRTKKMDEVIALSSVREQASIASFPEIIRLIKLNPSLFAKTFSYPFPVSPDHLDNVRRLYQTTFEREMRWAVAYLASYATEISEFLKLAKEFQKSLLLSNHEKCEEILSLIEEKFGYSLWYIKNKIAFLQISKGLEVQKAFTKFIREINGGNASVIAYFFSLLNEKNVTSSKYFSVFNDNVLEQDFSKLFKDYLKFHIRPHMSFTIAELHNVLSYETGRDIIDFYETFISICQTIVSSSHYKVFPLVSQALEVLNEKINDERIQYLLFELNDTYGFEPPHNSVNEALELFFEGKFLESYQFCKAKLTETPYNFDLIEIAAISLSLIDDFRLETGGTYLEKLVISLVSITNRENEISEDLANLLKTTMCFPNFSWCQALNSFYWKENVFFPPDLTDELQHFATTTTSSFNPLRSFSFSDKSLRQKFIENIKKNSTQDIIDKFCKGLLSDDLSNLPTEIFKELRFFLLAEDLVRNEEYEKAILVLDELIKTSYKAYKYQGIKLKVYCLFNLLRFEECLLLITDSYFQEPNLMSILPIKEIVKSIDKKTRKELRSQISLPIVLDIYSRHISNDKDTVKSYTYEDFLFSNNIQRPSELETVLHKFDKPKIVYFLRYLCIESVMDTSTVFQGSHDVTEERLKVCRMLVEIDPESTEIYRSEIKILLRRLMVQEKITEIEQSKIYVDVDGIKKKLEKTMKESFDRYISFLKNNVSFETKTKVIETVELVKKGDSNSLTLVKLLLPKNEMTDIFEQMVIEMRDEFVSSNVHGLDGYLSLRIRHGTLEGQLRKPLEDSKLITDRESTTGLYNSNQYWVDYLNITDVELREKIVNRLNVFAREFDELVQTIKNEWIQIKKTTDNTGLFDFTLFDYDLIRFAHFVTVETTFEEFTTYIFDTFFIILDTNLDVVRNVLDIDAKSKINELLTSLQNDLESYSPFFASSALSNKIIATRTEMFNVFNRIKEWFRLSSITNNEPFIIDDAISIGEEALRTTSHGLSVVLSNEKDLSLVFPGNRLSNIVDIFYIIFENIIRHSKLKNPKADIIIEQEGYNAYITIENKISNDVSIESANERIEAIKLGMKEGKYIKSISKEGGTGFHKIWKILSHEFKSTELDFGFKNDLQFFVKITLPLKG